jgi:hypothetical protein
MVIEAWGCIENRPGRKLLYAFIPMVVGAILFFLPLALPMLDVPIYTWIFLFGITLMILGGGWALTGGNSRSKSFGFYQVDFDKVDSESTKVCYQRMRDISNHELSTNEKESALVADYVDPQPGYALAQLGEKVGAAFQFTIARVRL